MHIYDARVAGYNFFGDRFDSEIKIYWPCGHETELDNPNLHDLGTAIGEHAIECEVCDDGRVGSNARSIGKP